MAPVALLEHVRQELLHECQQRVEAQRHEVLGVLWGQVGCGDEPAVWGGCIVEGVEVADLGANLLGQFGDGIGVGQVGGDDVCGCAGTGQLLGQQVERLAAAGHEDDGVTLSCVAAGDCLAEAGAGSEHGDGLEHGGLRRVLVDFIRGHNLLLEQVRGLAAKRPTLAPANCCRHALEL